LSSIAHIRQLLNQGRYLEARAESENLASSSEELEAKQLHALALSKSGTPLTAAEFFEPFHRQHAHDAETAGIMGGIYKELFRQTQNQKYALLSRDAYLNNFTITRNYYTGINAATMSAIAGKFQKGREIAMEVLAVVPPETTDFWEVATQAEAKLLMKDNRSAADLYFKAHRIAGADWGKMNSVYNQLWLLNHYVPVPGEILKAFSPPTVMVLVGHMIDHPKRPTPRFIPEHAPAVKAEITAVIKTLNARIGYTSLACGSDILFAEAMEESGGEVNVFLPFKKEDFIETSVRFAGEAWVDRFEKLFQNNSIHQLTNEGYLGNDDLFAFHGRVLFGLATLRGRMLHAEPYLVTVLSAWDRSLKEGGTRDLMKLWPFPSRTQNIDPSRFLPVAPTHQQGLPPPGKQEPNRFVLYMTAISFSGPAMEESMRMSRKMQLDFGPEMMALDFDEQAIYAGFNTSHSALLFGRSMIQAMEKRSLQARFRLSFHVGPVVITPVGDKKTMKGMHTEILKNIFMLGTERAVYATESFAASLVLDSASYSFIHTGKVRLDGELGEQSLYKVDWGK